MNERTDVRLIVMRGLDRQVGANAITGARVGVARGGSEAGVTQALAHERNGRAPVERVAGVGVAQPVGGEGRGGRETGARGGRLNDTPRLGGGEGHALA